MSSLRELCSLDCPGGIAAVWDDLRSPIHWTYSHLYQVSSSLSCKLRQLLRGCHENRRHGRPFVIGLYAFNSPETVSAILSILSIPAGYCPIKSSPSASVHSLIDQAGITAILVQSSLIKDFIDYYSDWIINWNISTEVMEYGFILISTDSFPYSHTIQCQSYTDPCTNCKGVTPGYQLANELSNERLAYLIHTTGTTGTPKQVWVPHSCIVPNIIDLSSKFDLNSNDRIFNSASLTFDPSVVEIFMTLYLGACLIIVPHSIKISSHLFTTIVLDRHHVTVLQATPSFIYHLPLDVIKEKLLWEGSNLRVLAFGGEACPSISTLKEWKCEKNETRLFNIYGITEVSSWATCYEIKLDDTDDDDVTVAIGNPLLDTVVQLRDNEGGVAESSGRIFIGGNGRVCCLGNETMLVPGTVRDSGDVGYIDGTGLIHVTGRRDRQIKRCGHRINLDLIQQQLIGSHLVNTCYVTAQPHPPNKLIAVIVPLVHLYRERFRELMFEEMYKILSNEEIPDELVIVDELPVNSHGKVELSLLKERSHDLQCKSHDISHDKWYRAVMDSISLVSKSFNEDIKLTDSGITSFDIVRIVTNIEEILQFTIPPVIYQLFLTKPLKEVIREGRWLLSNENTGFHDNHIGQKQNTTNSDIIFESKKLIKSEFTWYRRGVVNNNGSFEKFVLQAPPMSTSLPWQLHCEWAVLTGGCVDASPLVVSRNHGNMVYVGSHSGQLVAIQLDSGCIIWRIQLPNIIESSCCVSLCGEYIITGCCDGHVYVVYSATGDIYWCIKCSDADPIKSSPLCHPITGYIWFGSHDHFLYAIDIYNKTIVHRISTLDGSCFSSVTLSDDYSTIFIGTLNGYILAIDTLTGQIIWRYSCRAPVFSTPSLLGNNQLACGCVNGSVYILSSTGELIDKLLTRGPVFTSCITASDGINDFIFCGSHDRHMYCWESGRGSKGHRLKWTTELDGKIYSAATLTNQIAVDGMSRDLLVACTTVGKIYLLQPEDGRVLGSHALQGQIFSSPAVMGSRIIVGSRDDNVYSIKVIN